jgi:hypothetical protein
LQVSSSSWGIWSRIFSWVPWSSSIILVGVALIRLFLINLIIRAK